MTELVGRASERAALEGMLSRAEAGQGSLALVAGEAGVGKTRLLGELAEGAPGPVLRGFATAATTPPYGPVAGALREFLRLEPDAFAEGPLAPHLALLLPELGSAAPASDRATLFEAVRAALARVAEAGPALVVLDDLHWSDAATLELLGAIARPLEELRLVVVGAYRSDELPRDHPLRRLRVELRRSVGLEEVRLEGLDQSGTVELAARTLGGEPSPGLARTIQDRTQGIPLFIEALASALAENGAVVPGPAGVELLESADVPVPDTIREAVVMRTASLSEPAREAAEVAAVAGEDIDLALIAPLAGEAEILELTAAGFLVDREPGRAAFRHGLVRDALYEDTPWLRRRSLHAQMAAALEEAGGPSIEIATHWAGAGEGARARPALVRAVGESARVHAYRDAVAAGRQALDLWPEDEEPEARVGALERHGRFAELAGDLAEATRAWREVAAMRAGQGAARELGAAQRCLASIYALQGDSRRAVAAGLEAAEAYTAAGLRAEAAAERLRAAGHHQNGGEHSLAIALAEQARAEAAGRPDLEARAWALEGVARAKAGSFEEGLTLVRTGLSHALEHELNLVAAEAYQRLGTVLETAADYEGSREALDTAIGFCEGSEGVGQEQTCVSCMAYVLGEMGDWDEASELCRKLLDDDSLSGGTWTVATGILGQIRGFRGELRPARKLLAAALESARAREIATMQLISAGALAWVEAELGDTGAASSHCAFLLERWRQSEDRHYGVSGLGFAATFYGVNGDAEGVRACCDALSTIAAEGGHPDALAATAQALGEGALLEGDTEVAAAQLERAVELLGGLRIPFDLARAQLRAGVALEAAGEREPAVSRLVSAHRQAKALGTRPLAAAAARQLAEMGEPLEERLGRRAAAEHDGGGLTRRELEVMRLVAVGRTNREIASELYLSRRTVDMHVRNILMKLDCRSRTEAANRAGELGLLAEPSAAER